jgi:O-antigen/teichoic acid export membrane protein
VAISLYTSRVVLATLGADDFGLNAVVTGVITIFHFLNSSMAGTTSRFLTFELGKNDLEKLKKTFSASLTIHIIIAIIIVILGETVGLWYLENKMVIPEERMTAVRWVCQLSLASAMITITQVPYNATIIAHEKMNVYAGVEILNSLLRLGIVYLLVIGNFDKLILYSVLTLCMTIIITSIYKIYCTRNFPESHYKFVWNKEIIIPMLKFSVWDLYGNMSYMAKTQGINILLNLLGGVLLNAAYEISNRMQLALNSFSNAFLVAVRPQIVKYYAAGEIEEMQKLIINSSKFSFLLMLFVTLPLIIENHFILNLWLTTVPSYTVSFCQWILVCHLLTTMAVSITFAIHATGKIGMFSFTSGTILLLNPLISYFFLKAGFSPVFVFVINFILSFVYIINNAIMLHIRVSQFSAFQYFYKMILFCFVPAIVSSILPLYFHYTMNEGWNRFILVGITSILSISFSGYFIVLDKEMRNKTVKLIFNLFKRGTEKIKFK